MAKKKEKSTRPEALPGSAGMSIGLRLVPLLAVLVLLFYLALSMGYLSPFIFTLYQWKWALIIIQLVFIAILISSHALDRRSAPLEEEAGAQEVKAEIMNEKQKPPSSLKVKAKTTASAPDRPAAVPVESPSPAIGVSPSREHKPEIVEYPEKVSGGIYADTHFQIGDGKYLKLRTLIARSCLLCEEHDSCFTLVRHDMSMEGFDSNIDCKQGLNIEVSRA